MTTGPKNEGIRPGQRLELDVEALAAGGQGVARLPVDGGRLVVFVDHGLPGERLLVEITGVKPGHAQARRLECLSPSPDAAQPQCPHFADCGGCDWQDFSYAAQLDWKRRLVVDNFRRLPGLAECAEDLVAPCEPSPRAYAFRNKMEFAFAQAGRDLTLGLRRRGSNQVIPVPGCQLMAEPAMDLVELARQACEKTGLGVYQAPKQEKSRRKKSKGRPESTGHGVWRFLVLRQNLAGDLLAELITGPDETSHAAVGQVAQTLFDAFPSLQALVHSIRRAPTDVAYGEMVIQTLGPASTGRLPESIGDEPFFLSAGAFFQTNSLVAATLARIVDELAGPGDLHTVFDIYGGSGLLSRRLSPRSERIVVFESSARAVADGRDAAQTSGADRVEFRQGPASGLLAQAQEEPDFTDPDLVIVDPPRAGLDPGVRKKLVNNPPPKLVYVSCHAASQTRDLRDLLPNYHLTTVRPVDLFPHTPHIETVALLMRKF